jgi:hypothetical protein
MCLHKGVLERGRMGGTYGSNNKAEFVIYYLIVDIFTNW